MNIGPKEARKRLVMGIAMILAGVLIAFVLVRGDFSRWWRTALVIPFWMGALGFLQHSEKT